MKTRELTKEDLSDEGLKKLIKVDIEELKHLSPKEIISVWSFFKFLITEEADTFVTDDDSIIARYKKELERRCNLHIMELKK